jgi:ACR3 family arsenite efflux pump ArsB
LSKWIKLKESYRSISLSVIEFIGLTLIYGAIIIVLVIVTFNSEQVIDVIDEVVDGAIDNTIVFVVNETSKWDYVYGAWSSLKYGITQAGKGVIYTGNI